MTRHERLIKFLLFSAILIYYAAGYFFINQLTAQRHLLHHLAFSWEDKLPFYPALVFGYMLIFALLGFTYLFVDDLNYFKKVVQAFFICITTHFVIFLIFPVEYNLRPAFDPYQGWAYQLVSFYYWLDLPYNCFPSMHISNAFLVAFVLQRYRAGMGWILHPVAILVAISVVLVKQHYIADVLAGYLTALGVYRWTFANLSMEKAGASSKVAVSSRDVIERYP